MRQGRAIERGAHRWSPALAVGLAAALLLAAVLLAAYLLLTA